MRVGDADPPDATNGADTRLRRSLAGFRRFGAPGVVLALFVLLALFPSVLAPDDPGHCSLSRSLVGPSLTHPFGTDLQGCDYLSRVLFGAQTSMLIGGVVSVGAMAIALVLGTVAAWRGGWVDALVTRVADSLGAVPILLTALMIFGVTDERTLLQVVVVLTLLAWPPLVRLVRAAVAERLAYEHVEAARALGGRSTYILRRHVVPHAARPMIVFALPYAATIISMEAVLSFVGAGLQLPTISWGLMLAGNGGQLGVGPRVAHAPHLLAPGIVLCVLVWALVGVGARLRALDDAE